MESRALTTASEYDPTWCDTTATSGHQYVPVTTESHNHQSNHKQVLEVPHFGSRALGIAANCAFRDLIGVHQLIVAGVPPEERCWEHNKSHIQGTKIHSLYRACKICFAFSAMRLLFICVKAHRWIQTRGTLRIERSNRPKNQQRNRLCSTRELENDVIVYQSLKAAQAESNF